MQHATQVRVLKELIRQVEAKQNVDAGVMYRNPISSYTCPDMAAREREVLFHDHPQLVGLSGELPEPGHFVTIDDFKTPILATRDTDGRFRAFVNACRHRGVKLVNEKRGSRARFACPFHRWTYDSKGALVAIPQADHFGAVDKSTLGLIELPAQEKYGFLWVHPNPKGAIDVDDLLGDLAPELANWGFEKLIWSGERTIEKNLNWKLANDTFGETYHFQKLHKQTLGQLFYGDNLSYEIFGRNHRFVFANRALDFLKEQPEDEWILTNAAALVYYIFPNIQLIVGRGTANLVKIYPNLHDHTASVSHIGHYFTQTAIDADREALASGNAMTLDDVYDFEARRNKTPNLTVVNEVFDSTIEQEDYQMGELIQRAAESGAMEHVVFGRNEPALHHYHNAFRAALGLEPLEIYHPAEDDGLAAGA